MIFAYHTSVPLQSFFCHLFLHMLSLVNLFALLLASNAYWLHFITNFKVLYELNPLTIMTWKFNDHGLIDPIRQKVICWDC